MPCPAGDLLWKQKGAVEESRAELANKNPVYPNVSVPATSFVSELQTCRTACPDWETRQTVKIWTLKSYITTRRTLCQSSRLFLRGGEEMQLGTKFCKESESQAPLPQGFQTTPAWFPAPAWFRGPLRWRCAAWGRAAEGLFLESSPIVPRSGTGAKSSSCTLRAECRKPPLSKQPHVDPAPL